MDLAERAHQEWPDLKVLNNEPYRKADLARSLHEVLGPDSSILPEDQAGIQLTD